VRRLLEEIERREKAEKENKRLIAEFAKMLKGNPEPKKKPVISKDSISQLEVT
jgi:hypothetical protein